MRDHMFLVLDLEAPMQDESPYSFSLSLLTPFRDGELFSESGANSHERLMNAINERLESRRLGDK